MEINKEHKDEEVGRGGNGEEEIKECYNVTVSVPNDDDDDGRGGGDGDEEKETATDAAANDDTWRKTMSSPVVQYVTSTVAKHDVVVQVDGNDYEEEEDEESGKKKNTHGVRTITTRNESVAPTLTKPSQQEDTTNHSFRTRQVFQVGIILVVLVTITIVVVTTTLVLTLDNNENDDEVLTTLSPATDATTAPPTSIREGQILSYLSKQMESSGFQFNVDKPNSTHSLALEWIVYDDPISLEVLDTTEDEDYYRLSQRYVLAVLYYSTTKGGHDVWRSCNPPGIVGMDEVGNVMNDTYFVSDMGGSEEYDDRCILQEFTRLESDDIAYIPQTNKVSYRWMSNAHECNWEYVICDGYENVIGVEFCTYCTLFREHI